MKGTLPLPLPTRGFLQRRRKLEILRLCCWDHGASVQLLKHVARGAALGLKLEIKILYNPSFPFQKTFFSDEETNVRLDSFFMKCSPEMERSILRIATYHKGLEGCDGFQNLFVICMRLLVKGEKNPSATSSSSHPVQHPLPERTQGCRARRVLGDAGPRVQAAWAAGGGQCPPGTFLTTRFNMTQFKAAMQFIDTNLMSVKWPEQGQI